MHRDHSLTDLAVSDRMKDNFRTAARWAKIVAILGFVSVPFTLYESATEKDNSIAVGVIVGGIVVLVNIFLLAFSRKILTALDTDDQQQFNLAMNDLKMYFKIIGIVTIVVICIMVVAILIGVMIGLNSR